MRKILLGLLLLVLVGALAFFKFAPEYIEKQMNRIDGKPLLTVSEEAKALHATLQIVDLHSDTLMWRDPVPAAGRGHEDLPRLQQGNVALQLFASTTKSPRGQNYEGNTGETDNITPLVIAQLQPLRTWTSLLERSLFHGARLDRAVAGSNGGLRRIASANELDRLISARNTPFGVPRPDGGLATPGFVKPVGGMLTVEGLHNLEGNPANLDKLYAAGFRMAGLTHFFDNELAGSMHGVTKAGLTPMGKQIVARMEELGMIVDIAHLSHAGVAEVLASARRPVVSSHGGVKGTCQTNRNLTDEELQGVAKTGGVVGIGYWDAAICDTDPRAAARAMKYVRDLVGIDHVALGSDFDGATTTRFDTAGLVQITQALLDEGFKPEEIRAVMGGNALRVIRAGLVPMAPEAAPKQ